MVASESHYITMDLLLQNGANINAKDMPKMTALRRVAQRSHREVAELPLRYEADIDCLSKFHETPLDIAMDTGNTELMTLLQDGVQNQMNMNSDSYFIVAAGKTVARSTVQIVVGDGGRKVITVVTDQHGGLQPESPGEQLIVTLQGQQIQYVHLLQKHPNDIS